MFDYLRDPQAIYARSFELVREHTDLSEIPSSLQPLAVRLVHACGLPELVQELRWSANFVDAAVKALAAGSPVLADCEMLAHGIIRSRLPADNAVLCTLNEPGIPAAARAAGTTRSAAAVNAWLPHLDGALVAIGNAPTALFRLLELLPAISRPAAIIGFPVGFVGAAESHAALAAHHYGVPFITFDGRRGGSALAAAAVNALAGAPHQ
jgi:precorrin-8X/cobalt-precorrin-8 methylmutase